MRKIAFFGDVTLSIQNASLVLLGSPVDTGKPKDLFLTHDASPSSEHGQPRRLPILYRRSKAQTSYWESVVANPPGHTSTAGAHGTGSRKVTPDGSARLVSLIPSQRDTLERYRIKEGKQAVAMTRLSCHRFRSNEVRLWLSVIAYNLGHLWRRLALPARVANWSLTSLQQRLVKTGGRLVKHARYYWLLLAESHLTRRLFADMLAKIGMLPPSPAG